MVIIRKLINQDINGYKSFLRMNLQAFGCCLLVLCIDICVEHPYWKYQEGNFSKVILRFQNDEWKFQLWVSVYAGFYFEWKHLSKIQNCKSSLLSDKRKILDSFVRSFLLLNLNLLLRKYSMPYSMQVIAYN